jgi:hypothetical protein
MLKLEYPELAGLMGVKARVTPSKGGSLTVLKKPLTTAGIGQCMRLATVAGR